MKKTALKKVDFGFKIAQPTNQLRPGDVVKTAGGKEFRILDTFHHQGRKVFVTDRFGLIYQDELI